MADIERIIEGLIVGATNALTRIEGFLDQFESVADTDEEEEVEEGVEEDSYTRAREMSKWEWDSPQQRFASLRHLIDELEAQHQADISTMARLSSQNEQQAKEISRLKAPADGPA